MGGIQVTDMVPRQTASPGQRTVRCEVQVTAIVHVAALGVGEPAEQSLADHVLDHHAVAEVADVFGQHVQFAGLLYGAHQSPALVHGDAGGDFTQDRLAGPQGVDRHDAVILHRGCDDHGIEVVALEHSQIIFGSLFAEALRPLLPRFGYGVQAALQMRRFDVAHRGDLDVLDLQRQPQQMSSAPTNSDNATPNAAIGTGDGFGTQESGRRAAGCGEEMATID